MQVILYPGFVSKYSISRNTGSQNSDPFVIIIIWKSIGKKIRKSQKCQNQIEKSGACHNGCLETIALFLLILSLLEH